MQFLPGRVLRGCWPGTCCHCGKAAPGIPQWRLERLLAAATPGAERLEILITPALLWLPDPHPQRRAPRRCPRARLPGHSSAPAREAAALALDTPPAVPTSIPATRKPPRPHLRLRAPGPARGSQDRPARARAHARARAGQRTRTGSARETAGEGAARRAGRRRRRHGRGHRLGLRAPGSPPAAAAPPAARSDAAPAPGATCRLRPAVR